MPLDSADSNTKQRTVALNPQATGQLGTRQRTYQPVRHQVQAEQTGAGAGHQFLSGLANLLGKYGETRMVSELERAYVDGEKQRRLKKTEAELNSNFLTRPFVRGGWRDINYMMTQAEMESRLRKHIAERAGELTETEAQALLTEESQKFYESIDVQGASPRVRANATQALMQMEDSLMQLYTEKHQEQSSIASSQRVNAAVNTIMANAPSDFDITNGIADASTSVERLYTTLTNGIETMHPYLQSQVQVLALKGLYEDGHVSIANAVLDALQRDGGPNLLTLEQQQEIGSVKRQAQEKHAWRSHGEAIKMVAALKDEHALNGAIDESKLVNIMRYFDQHNFDYSQFGLAELLRAAKPPASSSKDTGIQAWIQQNKDGQDASGQTQETMSNGAWALYKQDDSLSREDRVRMYLSNAVANGSIGSHFGTDVQAAMQSVISNSDAEGLKGLPGNVELLQGVLGSMQVMRDADRANALAGILSRISDDKTQGILRLVLENPGVPLEVSLPDSIARYEQNLKDSTDPARKFFDTAKYEKRFYELGNEEYSSMWAKFKAALNAGEASPLRDEHGYRLMQEEVRARAMRLAGKPGYLHGDPEAIYRQAFEEVRNDTITWYSGRDGVLSYSDIDMLMLPEGFRDRIMRAPGVDGTPLLGEASISNDDLSKGLQALFKDVEAGSEYHFVASPAGSVQVFRRNKDTGGDAALYKVLTPTEVAQSVRAVHIKDIDDAKGVRTGTSVTVRDPEAPHRGDMKLTMRGMNGAGLPEGDVLEWKKHLLQREAFRVHAYEDPKDSGRYSVGAGHRLPKGYKPSDKPGMGFPIEYLDRWFQEDTEYALTQAYKIAQEFGFSDDTNTVLAVASGVYQLGPGTTQGKDAYKTGMRGFKQSLEHIAAGQDYDDLVRRSASWKWRSDTEDRVEDFLKAVKPRYDRNKPK